MAERGCVSVRTQERVLLLQSQIQDTGARRSRRAHGLGHTRTFSWEKVRKLRVPGDSELDTASDATRRSAKLRQGPGGAGEGGRASS